MPNAVDVRMGVACPPHSAVGMGLLALCETCRAVAVKGKGALHTACTPQADTPYWLLLAGVAFVRARQCALT